MEELPNEILANVLSYTNNQALVSISRLSKNLHTRINPTLNELRQIYHTLSEKNSREVVDACLNSINTTTAVMMSKTLRELNEAEIIKIACSSYDHATVVLKSYFIQNKIRSYIKNESAFIKENRSKKHYRTASYYNLELTIPNFDISPMATMLANELSLDIKSDINPIKIIEAIINQGIEYVRLVLKYAGEQLSGFRLMEIAKLSIEHARLILGSASLKNRLKPGHIIGIAKTSLEHAKYVLNTNFMLLEIKDIKNIMHIDKTYANLVCKYLLNLLHRLPLQLMQNKLELTQPTIIALIGQKFYRNDNIIWVTFMNKYPEQAKLISKAQNIVALTAINNLVIKQIIAMAMALSITHAKEVLAIPKIDQIFGRDSLQKLASKNEEYAELINNFFKNKAANESIHNAAYSR